MKPSALRPVPEERGHWLFGSVREFASRPHSFISDVARRHGGIAQFRILHKRFFATVTPEHAHHVFISGREHYQRGFHNRTLAAMTGEGLLVTEGALWEQRRRLIQPILHGDHAKRLVPIVASLSEEMLGRWEVRRRAGRPIAAVEEMQRLTIKAIVRSVVSGEADDEFAAKLGAAARDSLRLMRKRNTSPFTAPMWIPTGRNKTLKAHRLLVEEFAASNVDARNGEEGSDVLGAMIAARDPHSGERLSRAALIDEARTLVLAGFETTSTALAWTLYLLARHPDTVEKIYREVVAVLRDRAPNGEDLGQLRYTTQVAYESMRLYPPVYTMARECVREDNLAGYRIPRSAVMLVSIYGIHRGDAWGSDAEEFRPERFAPDAPWPRRCFLPFGLGKHLCAGNLFALNEIVTALACVVRKYQLRTADDRPVEPSAQITLMPSREILLRLEPRS